MDRLSAIVALGASLVLASSLVPVHADSATAAIAHWDTNHDGTLSMAEVDTAASAEFAKLDVDHDGTLDQKELGGRVTAAEFKRANPDNDGTLDKEEYLALVAKRFHAADVDNDGTLNAKELRSSAGQRLLHLLQ